MIINILAFIKFIKEMLPFFQIDITFSWDFYDWNIIFLFLKLSLNLRNLWHFFAMAQSLNWAKLKPYSMSKYPTFLANILILLSKSSPMFEIFRKFFLHCEKCRHIGAHTKWTFSFLWMTVDKLLGLS